MLEDLLADARDGRGVAGVVPEIRLRIGVETLRCEPRYMARAVVNLLRNALTHARSTVVVTLECEGGRNVIHVDDDGRGIPGTERDRLVVSGKAPLGVPAAPICAVPAIFRDTSPHFQG